jgi:hypothetical protein
VQRYVVNYFMLLYLYIRYRTVVRSRY